MIRVAFGIIFGAFVYFTLMLKFYIMKNGISKKLLVAKRQK